MMHVKRYLLATLLAAPFSALAFVLFFPPQCPADYTQAQVDASRCIIGANIGGPFFWIVATVCLWLIAFWVVRKFIVK